MKKSQRLVSGQFRTMKLYILAVLSHLTVVPNKTREDVEVTVEYLRFSFFMKD